MNHHCRQYTYDPETGQWEALDYVMAPLEEPTLPPPDPRRHPIQGDHIDDLVNWQLLNGRGY